MYIANLCAPGTYRSTLDQDGIPCVSCPQGFWSKNYGLREKGECTKCPPGSVCPVDGTTIPCAHTDLPSSFEPVIKLNGLPSPEYLTPYYNLKIYYSYLECLQLNDGYVAKQMDPYKQQYFYGELIPPYIDILNRGPNFRATDDFHLRYQSKAQCFRNTQRYGSPLYQRISAYYGPQYDIQFGFNHQGYGKINKNTGIEYYDGFFGEGSLSIDLPHARQYEPSFNCTRGFRLMNESSTLYDSNNVTTTVYTDYLHEPLNVARTILLGEDQLYPGTCESDIICYSAVGSSIASQAVSCTEGYVCDEATNSSISLNFKCRAGYVCDSGTTPDPSLEATMGQFRRVCPEGYYCIDGTTLTNAFRTLCPAGYYCPSGTGDPIIGVFANDAANRDLNLSMADPYINLQHVSYRVKGDVRTISDHEKFCQEGIDLDLTLRYERQWLPLNVELNNKYLEYLNKQSKGRLPYQNDSVLTGYSDGKYYRPKDINLAIKSALLCGRDHKWEAVALTIDRKECDCTTFFIVVIAMYRLWKCNSIGVLDNLGFSAITPPYNGGRDYWFPRYPKNVTQCIFPNSTNVDLTHGAITNLNPVKPVLGVESSSSGVLNVTSGIEFQFTWTQKVTATNYDNFKSTIVVEYNNEVSLLQIGNLTVIDPFVFDLYNSVILIEEYGEKLEDLIWLIDDVNPYSGVNIKSPGRYDMCECQNLNKCPNGTSSNNGAKTVLDCTSDQTEILRRISVIPTYYNETYPPALAGRLLNTSDFWELGGGDYSLPNGQETYTIGSITAQANDVVVITSDLSHISYNLTYLDHYQISVYVDCTPCPTRYHCDYNKSPLKCKDGLYPSLAQQQENFNDCLNRYKLTSCADNASHPIDCNSPFANVTFQEPDLFKCQQINFFCSDTYWPKLVWDIKTDINGQTLPAAIQESSSYINDSIWLKTQKQILKRNNHQNRRIYYRKTAGCCTCERRILPHFFLDTTTPDSGFPDNKHGFIQLSLFAVEQVQLTVVIELLHGQFYQDFDQNVVDKSDIYIHTPSRAINNAGTPSRALFMMILESSDITAGGLALPLNLPFQPYRLNHVLYSNIGVVASSYAFKFELKLFVGRLTDLSQGDPLYKTRYLAHMKELYLQAYPGGSNSTTFTDFANVPDLDTISKSLYPIPDLFSEISKQQIWWSTQDPAGVNSSVGYLGLPYLPYFSSCRGSDSFLSLSKVLESDRYCQIVPLDQTVPVGPWPWQKSFIPNADQCNASTPTSISDAVIEGTDQPSWLGPYNGALYQCSYEESISILVSGVTRWYEAGAFTTLWHFGIDPFSPADYEPQFSVSKNLTKTYSSFWGRGAGISGIRGLYKEIPVQVNSNDFGQVGLIPRRVILTLYYYQVDMSVKRLVKTDLAYPVAYQCIALTSGGSVFQSLSAQGFSPCTKDTYGAVASQDYLLEVYYIPMVYLQLINNFQFTEGIFLMIFIVTGIVCIMVGVFIFGINRLLTKLRHPPPFHGLTLLYTIAQPAIVGVCLGVLPVMTAILVIYIWFMSAADGGPICLDTTTTVGGIGSDYCLQNLPLWAGSATEQTRQGRQQLAIFMVGVYASMV